MSKIQKMIMIDIELRDWLRTKDINVSGLVNEMLLNYMKRSNSPDVKILESEYVKSKEAYEEEIKKLEYKKAQIEAQKKADDEKRIADEIEAKELEKKNIVETVEINKELAEELIRDDPLKTIEDIDKLLKYLERFREAGNNNVGISLLQKYIKIKVGLDDTEM